MMNPNTDRPNHASEKPTNSFHERYASDPAFKQQIDTARAQAQAKRTTQAVTTALAMPKTRTRMY